MLKTGIRGNFTNDAGCIGIFNVVENFDKGKPCCFYSAGSNGGDAYGVAILSAIAGKRTKIYSIGRFLEDQKKLPILW